MRLGEVLGYDGSGREFPIAFLRQAAPPGASPQEVWSRLKGGPAVQYFLAPLVGGPDSVLVQRFTYDLRWDDLIVDVEYQNGVAWDVSVSTDPEIDGRPLVRQEAYALLNWRPPE